MIKSSSALREEKPGKVSNNNFFEWLCGFTDGEGVFYIQRVPHTFHFVFRFEINLHIDDLELLLFIQKTLGVGKVYTYTKNAYLRVSKQGDIEKLIKIFDNYYLNTYKYLNFLDFKKAFELYTSNKKTLELSQEIANIKSGMNTQRSVLELTKYREFRITPYWFLGFVEGEGSFYVSKDQYLRIWFSLGQSSKDLALMEGIKNFLANLSDVKGTIANYSGAVNLYHNKSEFSTLVINHLDYIKTVLIPFFDSMLFCSKKKLDYRDWKSVINLKELGLHYTDEGLKIINTILSQMNNHRLSTSGSKKVDRALLQTDIDKLLSGSGNLEHRDDGTIFIKSLNRNYSARGKGSFKVKIQDIQTGSILNIFDTLSDCAKFLGISQPLASRRLKQSKSFLFEKILVCIKRVEDNG
jgi:hypothetical protein